MSTDRNFEHTMDLIKQIVYENEISKLKIELYENIDKTYLISKLGSGFANKFYIFEQVIKKKMKQDLRGFNNVKFLW